jgi:hypothetical protein
VIFALTHLPAQASPIQVNVTGFVDGHLVNQEFTLSDPSQPLNFPVASQQLEASVGPDGYYGGATVNSSFQVYVSVGAPGSSPTAGDSVEVSGTIQGSYAVTWSQLPNMSGQVSGTGTSASLSLYPGTSPSDVPSYLVDLLNNPSRVNFGGVVTGGGENILATTLSIAPPVDPSALLPVPEPSMLAFLLASLLILPIARKRRRSA